VYISGFFFVKHKNSYKPNSDKKNIKKGSCGTCC
jgi:hypothetical protein